MKLYQAWLIFARIDNTSNRLLVFSKIYTKVSWFGTIFFNVVMIKLHRYYL